MPSLNKIEPTADEWRNLYKQGLLFRDMAPWRFFDDAHLFAVELPETQEVMYCSVMGAAGLEYGLLAYRGVEGLLTYALLSNDVLDDDEALIGQDCLSFSMGDREHVDEVDRAVHSSVGLKFRGKGNWPLFRSLRPLRTPHYLDQHEARAMATVLEQACSLVEDILSGAPLVALSEGDELMLSRRMVAGTWQTTSVPSPPLPSIKIRGLDQKRLEAVRATCSATRQTWETMAVALAAIGGDTDEAGFWARVLLCVDKRTGMVLPGNVLEPEDNLQDAFLEVLESTGTIPQSVAVSSGLLEVELRPLTEALGIRLRRVSRLREAERARQAMKQAFRRH